MASITEVARLAGVSIATASRVVGARPTTRSAPRRASACSTRRRTLDYVPNALARGLLKSQLADRRRHRPRHHRPVLRRGRAWRRGRRRTRRATSSSRAARIAIRNGRTRTSGCCARCAPRAVIFAGSGMDDPELNAELGRHVAEIRANGAAVVHLSPHALRRAGGRRRQRGRHRRDGRRPRRPRPPADRLPGRAVDALRRPRAPGRATGAGWPTPASRRTSGIVIHTDFDRAGGARGVDELLATRRRVHGHLLRQRPARARRARSASPSWASASRAGCRWPASTTSRWPRMTAPHLSTVPAAAARARAARLRGRRAPAARRAGRRGGPADRGRPARLDRRPRTNPGSYARDRMSLNLRGIIPACVVTLRRRRPVRRGRRTGATCSGCCPRARSRWRSTPTPARARTCGPTSASGCSASRSMRPATCPIIAGLSAHVHRAGGRGGQARRAGAARAGCSCSRSPPTRARRSTRRSRSPTTRQSRAAAACR